MKEKRRKWIEKRVVPYLEQGETIRLAVAGATRPEAWTWIPIPGLPVLSNAEKVVVLTNRNLYVLSGHDLDSIDAKHVIGSVDVRFDGNALFIGPTKIRVGSGSQTDAAELAAAISGAA